MIDDSPFAAHDNPDALKAPAVTDAQLDQVDAMHDAEAAEDAAGYVDAYAGDAVDASIPGAADPLDTTLTEVKCEKCGSKAKWTGPLTAEMLERTFSRGVGPDGLPNCVHCGTPMVVVPFLTAQEAIAQIAQALDAERAGDAARPMHQPSIPGILPAFDWRRAQLTTESLEENVANSERLWEASKKETAEAKKSFDDDVDTLRKHIQAMHRARVDAEYQARRPAGEPAPEGAIDVEACTFEKATGKPCPICRNPVAGIRPAVNTDSAHVAAAAVTLQANDQLESSGLRTVIATIAGVELLEETVRGWSAVERAQVLGYLETPGVVERPPQLGTPHEAADPSGKKQACRICGGAMPFLPEEGTWPLGQLVGTDCPGEPSAEQEPARRKVLHHGGGKKRQKTEREVAAPAASASTEKKRMAKATKTPASRKGAK